MPKQTGTGELGYLFERQHGVAQYAVAPPMPLEDISTGRTDAYNDAEVMHCAFCKNELAYVHGHAACVKSGCPMFGVNQAECCSGETAACGPLTAAVAGSSTPPVPLRKPEPR
jgi:hypothetical protein